MRALAATRSPRAVRSPSTALSRVLALAAIGVARAARLPALLARQPQPGIDAAAARAVRQGDRRRRLLVVRARRDLAARGRPSLHLRLDVRADRVRHVPVGHPRADRDRRAARRRDRKRRASARSRSRGPAARGSRARRSSARSGSRSGAGFPALALAIGMWLDGVLAGARTATRALPPGAMLVGAVRRCSRSSTSARICSRSPSSSPRCSSAATPSPYPKDVAPAVRCRRSCGSSILGVLVARRLRARDDPGATTRRRARCAAPRRSAPAVALAGTALVAAFWAFAWQPALATHLSSKAMFDTYNELQEARRPARHHGRPGPRAVRLRARRQARAR